MANMLLQLAAIPLIAAALLVHPDTPAPPPARQALALLGALMALLALELLPLPPQLWTLLPGRGAVADGYRLLGQPLPWLSLSLAPKHTLAAALWLLPAAAVLLAMVRLGAFGARSLGWTLAGLAAASVALGAVQLAGGDASPAYVYAFTSWGVAVGFFANANHFGTLMLVTMPFLAALLPGAMSEKTDRRASSAVVIIVAATFLVAAVGLAITQSLAALGLAVPVAGGCWLVARHGAVPRWALPAVLVLGAAALAAVMSQPFGNNLTGADAHSESLSRYTSFSKTATASLEYAPFGSGTGSFLDVYRQQEDPATTISTYVNHAHSDPLEIWLETGLAGLALMLLFLAWWVRQTFAIWRAEEGDPFARAATIASGAVMAHSLVDYPLRTAAISALFAMCVALMAGARERTYAERRERSSQTRHLSA